MEFTHTTSIQFGLQTSMEYPSTFLHGEDEQHFSYCRIDLETKSLQSDHGIVTINIAKQKLAFLYDGFQIVGEILSMKKVADNYHFKCVNDLMRFDVYIVEPDLWIKNGESLFE